MGLKPPGKPWGFKPPVKLPGFGVQTTGKTMGVQTIETMGGSYDHHCLPTDLHHPQFCVGVNVRPSLSGPLPDLEGTIPIGGLTFIWPRFCLPKILIIQIGSTVLGFG